MIRQGNQTGLGLFGHRAAPSIAHALPQEWISSLPGLLFTLSKLVVAFLLAMCVLKASLFEAFFVPSGSMDPTLQPKDYILLPKLSYGLRIPFVSHTLVRWGEPKRGDIVVFNRTDDPLTERDESVGNLVKRVIALSGDTVAIVGTRLLINGQQVTEPYARWIHGGTTVGDFGPITVPHGEVFVLGDNRDESKDSRLWRDPFVNLDMIQGRALVVYWSSSDSRRSGTVLE